MGKKYLDALRENVLNLDFEGVKRAAEEAMEAGVHPIIAVTDGLSTGLKIVGEKFEKGEFFLSELIVGAEVMKEGMSVIEPYIEEDVVDMKGKVVLATVEGDHHDIGKNLVATLLRVSGFEVIDLGIDVPKDMIIETVKIHRPQILGLSALITVTMSMMGEVIDGLKVAGLRDDIKVIVGGSPMIEEFAEKIGADHRAIDAVEGVKKCIEWVG